MDPASTPPPALSSPTRWGRWREWVPTASVIVTVAALHLRFILLDRRLPTDLNGALGPLASFYAALQGDAAMPWGRLWETSAAWSLAIAGWLSVFGRDAVAFRSLDLVSNVAVLLTLALLAWRALGHRGAFVAVALAGGSPVALRQARTGWIHTPEMAILLGCAAVLVADPALRRRATRVGVALTGMAALLVRPSAAVFLAGIGLMALFAVWRDGEATTPERRRRLFARLGLVVALWGLACAPAVASNAAYFVAKFGARARYETQLPPLMEQLPGLLGKPFIWIGGALAILGLRAPGPARFLSVAWIGGALLSWGVFKAGIDNFPMVVPGLALLAAAGVRTFPRPGAWGAAAVPLLSVAYQLGPQEENVAQGPSAWRFPRPREGLFGYDVPFRSEGGGDSLPRLIDAVCDKEPRCDLWIDQGLVHPYGEDAGTLELFLVDRPTVVLHDLRQGLGDALGGPVDALVYGYCPSREMMWRQRYPQSYGAAERLRAAYSLQQVWFVETRDCMISWWTPNGGLRRGDALPPRASVSLSQ